MYACERVTIINTCLKWVYFEQPQAWYEVFAITKSEMLTIGTSIVTIFGIYVAYAFVAKALNMI